MKDTLFPLINLAGTPRQIGYQHGQLARERIEKSVLFYKNLFAKDESWIVEKAQLFKDKIAKFSPHLMDEIEGISQGSGLPLHWIIALNSRTEIVSFIDSAQSQSVGKKELTECTTICIPEKDLLGQTWDWFDTMQELSIVLRIRKDNNTIITLTEPGIVAKIGLNSSGIGVGLNFLITDKQSDGVPIHILLREILESKNIEEWKEKYEIVKQNPRTTSCITMAVAGKPEEFKSYEFFHSQVYELKPEGKIKDTEEKVFFRTNHYLATELQPLPNYLTPYPNSLLRYEAIQAIFNDKHNVDHHFLQNILKSKPFCRDWEESTLVKDKLVGTVCVVVMDLKKKVMFITNQLNVEESGFVEIKIE